MPFSIRRIQLDFAGQVERAGSNTAMAGSLLPFWRDRDGFPFFIVFRRCFAYFRSVTTSMHRAGRD
jgi:hypothetical protein